MHLSFVLYRECVRSNSPFTSEYLVLVLLFMNTIINYLAKLTQLRFTLCAPARGNCQNDTVNLNQMYTRLPNSFAPAVHFMKAARNSVTRSHLLIMSRCTYHSSYIENVCVLILLSQVNI